ncbi:MAG: hypothetical protein IKY83_00560 [Proteobacteria bacterium]|nr:hypothetical protein [Pseudomonadota bacterium]
MELWTNDIDEAVSVLVGEHWAVRKAGCEDVWEGASFGIWQVAGLPFGAPWGRCLFERFADGSQFDRLRAWQGDEIFAIALDGTGFHGQHGRVWQSGVGNLYLSIAMPVHVDAACVKALMALPARAVIEAVSPLMTVMPEVKVPNDVVVRGADGAMSKMAGCLTEVRMGRAAITQVRYGIGINIAHAPEIKENGHLQACALSGYLRDPAPPSALYRRVLAGVLACIARDIAQTGSG